MAILSIFAIMASTQNIHALHPSRDLPTSAASELKNAFKGVFQQALREGPVSITRNRKREAILLSAELYDQMIAELAARDPLETLRKEYDARFASVQSAASRAGYEKAFDATSEELGNASAAQAASR